MIKFGLYSLIPMGLFTVFMLVYSFIDDNLFLEKADTNNTTYRIISFCILYIAFIFCSFKYLKHIYNTFTTAFFVISIIIYCIFIVIIILYEIEDLFYADMTTLLIIEIVTWFFSLIILVMITLCQTTIVNSLEENTTVNITYDKSPITRNFSKIDLSEYMEFEEEVFLIICYDGEKYKDLDIPQTLTDNDSDYDFEIILNEGNNNCLVITTETTTYNFPIYKDNSKNLCKFIDTTYELHIDKSHLSLDILK